MSAFSVTLENKIRARIYKLFLSTILIAGIFFSIPFYLKFGFKGLAIGLFFTVIFSVLMSTYVVRINYPISVSISEEGILFKYAGKSRPLRVKALSGRFGPKNIRVLGYLSVDWKNIKTIKLDSDSKMRASSKIIFNDDSWQSLGILDKEIVDEIVKVYEGLKSEQKTKD